MKRNHPKPVTEALLDAIKRSDQTVCAIARATGLQRAALSRFVAGRQSLRLDLADRLVTHFGMQIGKGRRS